MNARNYLYIYPHNEDDAKRIADDKLETKKILIQEQINTPELIMGFEDRTAISDFDWNSLPERGFVIKPARGYAGAGILPIRKFENGKATSITGESLTIDQLKSHCFDVLDGGFSLQFLPDKAFIEHRLVPYTMFKKIGAIGIPDIRVIVFHHIPVMAMLRFPTRESGGKANISLGALMFGIDMRTGITTGAAKKREIINHIPGTKIKTRGIRIPNWDEILTLAARTQSAIGLGYAGIDIVLTEDGTPTVLEVNARPGLGIQMANKTSLRSRLERIEHIPIPSPKRGVEVAKSLFAEGFSEKVKEGPTVLSVIQNVTLQHDGNVETVDAKLDTGAYRTSVDIKLAEKLNLQPTGEYVSVYSATGKTKRPLYRVTLLLAGKKIQSTCSVIDRSRLKYPVIIGRLDLKDFLIKPVLFDGSDVEENEL